MSYAHLDFVFGLQALRRRVERDGPALGGALGAALQLLPHQVANAARILTDLEVRHLLADEVGLGKTAQAIMVYTALRLQRRSLRAAFLVPDALAAQWRDELRSRAHVAPVEGSDDGDDVRPRLLWPQVLRAEELDLGAFDLLVVDEPQQLTEALQRRVAAAAPSVDALLILTATPPFRRPAEMRRLLQMIEPSRVGGADEDAFAELRARELAAHSALASGAWPEDLGGPPPSDDAEASASAAHGAARRILRTRRSQWSRHLPRREPRVREVEPTATERERQRLMWSYFGYLTELSREFDLDLLAQRALRGPASLLQRVTYLKGHGHERGDILAQVRGLIGPQLGDSRFDALLDILCELWEASPEEPVLIAAGDNLTVDDLAKRLPRLFDDGPTGPLTVAVLRNQTRGADSLADSDDLVANAVRAFQTGEAQVLLAAEVGSFGLNLQHARHIVLYSIPWDPSDVEQWIGRVDRIGNTAIEAADGEVTPIVVHVPSQRGLVDQRVVAVLEATGILERSISLDADAVHAAREAIVKAALSDDPRGWGEAMAAAREVGASRELEDLGLPLLAASPWSPARAAEVGARLVREDPLQPAMRGEGSGERGRERALYDWLRAMASAGEYELRHRDRASKIRSLGYPQRALRPRTLDDAVRVPLDQTLVPWPRRPYVNYRTSRAALEQPPLTYHQPEGKERQQLYFLDHGSPLHEELIEAWLQRLPEAGRCHLRIPKGHPLAAPERRAALVVVAVLHPDRLLRASDAPLHLAEADVRFLRLQLPARLLFAGALVSPTGVAPMDEASVRSLIAPPVGSPLLEPRRASDWGALTLPEAAEERAAATVDGQIRERAAAAWSHRLPSVRSAVARRAYAIRADLADRSRLASRGAGSKGTRGRSADGAGDLEGARQISDARIEALERALEDPWAAIRRCGSLWALLDSDP